jgi:hypothetical protein
MTKYIIAATAVATALALASPAHAEDWKAVGQFGWLATGKVYQIEKGHVFLVGEYSGTFFNDKGEGSLAPVSNAQPLMISMPTRKTKRPAIASSRMPPATRLISHGRARGTVRPVRGRSSIRVGPENTRA